MSLIRPKILLRYGRQQEPIRIPTNDLVIDATKTFLTADSSSGSGTLTVQNITNFAINQVLLIGEPGNQTSEIIKTHASTAPTGSTITLSANTTQNHNAGTNVYLINFDQIEFSSATTLTGTKSVLATSNIVANDIDTKYNDTAGTTGYYFARFKNTITSTFSSYSDGVPVSGYAMGTVRYTIDSTLGMINKRGSTILTDEFLYQEIDNCQKEVLKEQKRWDFMQVFDAYTDASVGNWRIAVPTDIEDANSIKSIYNFRIGKEPPMTWVDKEKWDELVSDVAWTTLASSFAIGASSITLTDSSDFDSTGTIQIGGNSITYTANNKTTGVLTISPITTVAGTSGVDVFQNASLGSPKYYTVFGGYIYHYPVVSTTLDKHNYLLDYYSAYQNVTGDNDAIVIPDDVLIQFYLAWKSLLKLNNGEETPGSSAMNARYEARKKILKNKESPNRTFHLKPQRNNWARLMAGLTENTTQRDRLGNFPNS